jgi:hypothetical protein
VNPSIEKLYQSIGQEIVLTVEDELKGKIVLYAAVEDGAGSISIFGAKKGTDVVHMQSASDQLKELVFDFWDQWQQQPDNKEWRVMCYVIDGSSFSIDLTYPDQINSSPDDFIVPDDYHEQVVRKYFSEANVDYSGP